MNKPTSTPVSYQRQRFDNIYRLYGDMESSKQGYTISLLGQTQTFAFNTLCLMTENDILKRAVRNLWKTYLYNREYISFLLGTRSREDLRRIAEEFAEPYDTAPESIVKYAAHWLASVVEKDIDVTDLSLMLNLDHNEITDIVKIADNEATGLKENNNG